MAEFLTPGLYLQEVPKGSRPIEGVSTSTAGMLGLADRGPAGVPTFVTSFNAWKAIFGEHIAGSYSAYAVETFFRAGGKRLYFNRVVGTGALASDGVVNNDDPVKVYDIAASSPGLWGDNLEVVLTFDPVVENATIVGANVSIGHGTVGNPIKLTTDYGIAAGTFLRMYNGTSYETLRVASITPDGSGLFNVVTVAACTLAYTTVNGRVWTIEFRVDVYESDVLVETFRNLSPDPTADNYAPTVIGDESVGSAYITLTDQNSPPADIIPNMLTTPITVALGSGADGAAPTNDEQTDSFANFDTLTGLSIFLAPDFETAVVQNAGMAYAETRKAVYVASVPVGSDPTAAREYRTQTANFNSNYGSLYWPWVNVTDPIGVGSNPVKLIPPSAFMAGVFGACDSQPSPDGVWSAPAGVQFNLGNAGAVGIEYDCKDSEQAILNPIGVNVLRKFPGDGIVPWGARQVTSNSEWKYIQHRRLFNYVEQSLLAGTRWAAFQNNGPRLWGKLTTSVTKFLRGVWEEGGLAGTSIEEAFYVRVDETNNPPALQEQGRVCIEVGLAVQYPAEFVVFKIGQFESGAEIEEGA